MTKRLNDFVTNSNGMVNVSLLEKESVEDLRAMLVEASRVYLEEHKKFLPNHSVQCYDCKQEVDKPENLIRYFGLNLHPDCFKKTYAGEKENILIWF